MLTTVTSLIPRPGLEPELPADFERAFRSARGNSHHLSTLLIQQRNGPSLLVSQFNDRSDLAQWRRSASYRQMIEALERHSLRELCEIEQQVVRIEVPTDTSGPKWKVLISTWIITFPLLYLIILMLEAIASDVHPALLLAITSISTSAALLWFIAPTVNRMTRVWRLSHERLRVIPIDIGGAGR